MNLIYLMVILIMQLAAGFGLLSLLKIFIRPGLLLPLTVLIGIAIFSLVPFLLQLFYLPLTALNIFTALLIVTALLNIKSLSGFIQLKAIIKKSRFRIRLYELPAMLAIFVLVFISCWKCFFHPPTPRDLTSGPEVVAEYAVREKTMINSVFTVDLSTTNNPFKPSFITSLQVIYKYAGFPFGQVWLSIVFIAFLVFLYHALKERIHPLIAGILLVFFIVIPEMYAYTIMVLFDYSNAVYFFLSCYFLFEFLKNHHRPFFILSAFLMAIAVYIRSETLILVIFFLPLIFTSSLKQSKRVSTGLLHSFVFVLPVLGLYLLSVPFYIHYYLPVEYAVNEQINHQIFNLQSFFNRFTQMHRDLIFKDGINYYGYFSFLFLLVLFTDMLVKRKMSTETKYWLYAILVIYIGLPLIGHLVPLFDIDNSTKRGLFKIFPLMLLYMGNSSLLSMISEKINKFV